MEQEKVSLRKYYNSLLNRYSLSCLVHSLPCKLIQKEKRPRVTSEASGPPLWTTPSLWGMAVLASNPVVAMVLMGLQPKFCACLPLRGKA